MKSTEVMDIYNKKYFIEQVDGAKEFKNFTGKYFDLFKRYRRNIKLLDLEVNHNLLEYGCGRGEVCIFHRCRGGKAIGVDYSTDAINLAREKAKKLKIDVEFFNCNFSDFNFSDNSFDRILASEFIEHISKEEGFAFFNLSYKALKPGGKLLVFTYPNTLQRRFGYHIMRFMYLFLGKRLPRKQPDMISEHYAKYHLNEQSYFSLRNSAKRGGFNRVFVGYDINCFKFVRNKNVIKKFIKTLIISTFLRHFFLNNLYLLAEK